MGRFDSYGRLFIQTIYTSSGIYSHIGEGSIIGGIDCPVQIGIDESTSQTGLCICDMKGNLLMLVDLINKGLPKAEIFLAMLEQWVDNNFPQLDIRRIIYEEINQNAPQQYARKRLIQVVSVFERYYYRAPHEFELCSINNLTWKKHLLAADKFKGRRKKTELVKEAAKEALTDLYPEAQEYMYVNGKGDSADAFGVVYGYMHECFLNADGKHRRVNATMKSTPIRKYAKKYMDFDEFAKLVQSSPEQKQKYSGYKYLTYNSEYTLEENCLRAINYCSTGVVLIDPSDTALMQWKFDSNRELSHKAMLIVTH